MKSSRDNTVTKRDLIATLNSELDAHHMSNLDGISENSTKADLQNALDCLRATDEEMGDYLTVIKLKYPNMYRAIIQSNYLRHSHNRLFVYNTARNVLA